MKRALSGGEQLRGARHRTIPKPGAAQRARWLARFVGWIKHGSGRGVLTGKDFGRPHLASRLLPIWRRIKDGLGEAQVKE